MRLYGSGDGEAERDRGALPRAALGPDSAVMGVDHSLGDCKPQPGSSTRACPGGVGAVEAVKDVWQISGRNAAARISYRDADHLPPVLFACRGIQENAATRGRVPQRVRHQVAQHLRNPLGVGLNFGQEWEIGYAEVYALA